MNRRNYQFMLAVHFLVPWLFVFVDYTLPTQCTTIFVASGSLYSRRVIFIRDFTIYDGNINGDGG